MRTFYLIIISFIPLFSLAQGFMPRCNFDSLYSDRMQSIDYRDLLMEEEKAFQIYMQEKQAPKNSSYTIPVVVHIIKNESHENWVDMDITDADVYRQIEILNESYNLLNQDVSQTPEEFEEFIGNAQIEFCLASVDPNGYATNGINRYSTDVTSFSTVLDNIKRSEDGGADAWDTDSYLNIWVGRITTGVLGYSDNPTANIPDDEHGFVVGFQYFGESDHENYGMGKTAVHEIGHYLNLKHPWGSGNCDAANDWVNDTPISEDAYYGNPVHPQTSCETVDMFMNYMDYVDDSSMVMFSQGQVDRMHYALDIFRPTLQESNGCGVPYLVTQPEFTHASSESASDGAIHLDIAYGQAPFTIICQDTVSQTIVDSVVLSSYGNYSIVNLSEADYLVEIIDALGETTSLDFSISYYGSVFDSDNFESYTEDSLLFTQSNEWVSFCKDSFAANISSNLPVEGLQYLEINAADGLNSFLRDFNVDLNAYDLSFKMYVPFNRSASYTIYHDATCFSSSAAYKIQFNVDGQGYINVAGQNIPFDFPQNTWFTVNQLIDMDRDIVEFSIADQVIQTWNFSSTINSVNGTSVLDAIVFNDRVDSMTQVHYFIDDFKMVLSENSDLGYEDISNELDVILYPNPTRDEIYLKFNDASYGNIQVKVFNLHGQVLEFIELNDKSSDDLRLSLSHYDQGVYFVSIQKDSYFKTLKFIIQH